MTQPRLLSVNPQTKTHETFVDHAPDLLGVLQPLEAHDKIIGETNHEGVPPASGLDGFNEPFVQHLMQADITDWRNDTALRCALLRVFAKRKYSSADPYQSEYDS